MVTLFPLLFSPHVIRRIFFKTMYNDDLSRKIKMNDPDMGIWQYFYNEYSEMTNQLDARTNTVAFHFDTRGRLTNKSARYGLEDDFVSLAEYEYGTNGFQYNRLSSVSENNGDSEETYFYDILGTATNISRYIIDGGTYQRGFAYDALGRITTVVYPHKADNAEPYTIRYEYHDQNGLLNKISEVDSAGAFKTNLLSGISYDHYGRRKVMTYGNNVTTYYSYDALTGLLNNQEVMKNAPLQNVNYVFDASGNVLSKEDTQNGIKHEYGYDDLNRLLSSKLTMTSAEPGQQEDYDETFSYDPLGNILTKDKQGGYGYSDYVYTRAHAVESYTYTRNNLGTPEETDVNIEYDANGNMAKKTETTDVKSKTTTYEWDIENRLSMVKEGANVISSYLYDHTGERLKKTANGSSVYYFGGMSQIKADANNSAQHFVFDGVNRIAAAVTKSSQNSEQFWMHTDHIGSTSMITSATGEKIQRLVYKAFGKIHAHWEKGAWSLGETALLGGIGFTGQEHDDETGLMYYGARYYDAGMGRFISADTMVPDPMNTQDFGRYTYVRNNPVQYTDPSGHTPEDDQKAIDAAQEAANAQAALEEAQKQQAEQEEIDRLQKIAIDAMENAAKLWAIAEEDRARNGQQSLAEEHGGEFEAEEGGGKITIGCANDEADNGEIVGGVVVKAGGSIAVSGFRTEKNSEKQGKIFSAFSIEKNGNMVQGETSGKGERQLNEAGFGLIIIKIILDTLTGAKEIKDNKDLGRLIEMGSDAMRDFNMAYNMTHQRLLKKYGQESDRDAKVYEAMVNIYQKVLGPEINSADKRYLWTVIQNRIGLTKEFADYAKGKAIPTPW